MKFTKLVKGKIIDVQEGFVDTFNRMVDCWNNLSGEGKTSVVWNGENHPVIKTIISDTGSSSSSSSGSSSETEEEEENEDLEFEELQLPVFDAVQPQSVPWTFVCTENNGVRTGGWTNGLVQVGLEFYSGDYDVSMPIPSGRQITNCAQTADGDYYVEVKPSSHTAQLKRMASAPSQDFANNTYYIYIGTVENGVQKYSVCCAPVIYTYL